MSWASRRRGMYAIGVVLFFLIVFGGPVFYWRYSSTPPVCPPGTMRPSGVESGPCSIIDESTLQPHAILWARAFRVRGGSYSATAYIQNPNKDAGVRFARYRFDLSDTDNVLVAERMGVSFLMPGAITPVFESRIDTGSRVVAHTYFEFTAPLSWERLGNVALAIEIDNKEVSDTETSPRLTATAQNNSVADIINPAFVAVVFDPAGNAFAASATELDRLAAGSSSQLVFTWPDPFAVRVGRIDIIPLVEPTAAAVVE